MNKLVKLVAVGVVGSGILAACGGGDSSTSSNSQTKLLINTASAKISIPAANVTASSTDAANIPGSAVDNNLGTHWTGGAASGNQWIQFKLPSCYTVDFTNISWYNGNQRQYGFTIEASADNGATWTTVKTATSAGTSAALVQTDFPNTAANMMRVSSGGSNVSTKVSINEVEFWGLSGATCSSGNTTTTSTTVATTTTTTQASGSDAPYGGTPAAIPGTVRAENYNTGGQGVDYSVSSTDGSDDSYRSDSINLEATAAPSGGNDLGWTNGGQWFHYTVNVATAGTYAVTFEVAAPGAVTNAFHLSNASGANLSGSVNIPATGDWQAWTTVTANVTLPAGQQVLTLNEDNGGWNINTLAFARNGGLSRRSPSEVLVVYNASSPISKAIATYYQQKRGVTNAVAVNCADSALSSDAETITLANYTAQIATPISNYLASHSGINFIVLTKGVPIRISGAPTGSEPIGTSPHNRTPSVDSYLAVIDYPNISGAVHASITGSGATGVAWINRYYNQTVPFTHAQFGGYLVTRLDGYTQANAQALVDNAIAAEQNIGTGQILLDVAPDFGIADPATPPPATPLTVVTSEEWYGIWNGDMVRAGDILKTSGIPVNLAVTNTFVGNKTNLLGYYSWGSNDNHYDVNAYKSLYFAPGAIGDTAVSSSGRTFLPTNDGGQSLIADLIAHGITGVRGYVNEPDLDANSSPTIALTHYLSGYSLAESVYSASRYIGWEDVNIGDPLCAPYLGKYTIVIPSSFPTPPTQ